MSEASGVPVDEIEQAISVYESFFESMMTDIPYTQFRAVKMVPIVFRGIGALLRKKIYGVERYSDLRYSDKTGKDLAAWHAASHAVLAGKMPAAA